MPDLPKDAVVISIIFPNGPKAVEFTTQFQGVPTEGQFELAGRELIALSDYIRSGRLSEQIAAGKKAAAEKAERDTKTPIGPPATPSASFGVNPNVAKG